MEVHDTVFETEDERKQQGLPVRMDFMPFSELPILQDLVYGKDSIPHSVPRNSIAGRSSDQKSIDSPVMVNRNSSTTRGPPSSVAKRK
jgi:hypothetical protein